MALAIKYSVSTLIEATTAARERARVAHRAEWERKRQDRLAEIKASLSSLSEEAKKIGAPGFTGEVGSDRYYKISHTFPSDKWDESIARLLMIEGDTVSLNEKDNHFLALTW